MPVAAERVDHSGIESGDELFVRGDVAHVDAVFDHGFMNILVRARLERMTQHQSWGRFLGRSIGPRLGVAKLFPAAGTQGDRILRVIGAKSLQVFGVFGG